MRSRRGLEHGVRRIRARWIARAGLVLVMASTVVVVHGQAPAQAGRGGGRGPALPGATPAQSAAVAAMTTALAAETAAVNEARTGVAAATFATPRNPAALTSALDRLRAAELSLALKRANEFATLQSGPNKLGPEQIAALAASVSGAGRGGPPPAAMAPGGRGTANGPAGRGQ